jgi:homoserine/homoserine lactone efflux protein
LVTSLNPKALIFVAALLPQFIDPTLDLLPQVFVLCLTSAVIHFTIYFCYAALACKTKHLLNSDNRRRRFNQLSGVTFLVFGMVLLLSGVMGSMTSLLLAC